MTAPLQQQANEVLDKILQQNGPEMHDYEMITQIIDQLEDVETFRKKLYRQISPGTLFYHTYTKPRGYAGDYELIAKLYSKSISTNPKETKWDLFYHSVSATQAVRNRKLILEQELLKYKDEKIKILVLGCGPSEDVFNFLSNHKHDHLHLDLLDMDADAISYSKAINQSFSKQISFINANILRYSFDKTYDLIYASGLFDYFNDRVFQHILKKIFPQLNEKGKILIGNFAENNPSRFVMEKMADWVLHHRSPESLKNLALSVQPNLSNIDVYSDSTGINLFLEIQKS